MGRYDHSDERFARARILAEYSPEVDTVLDALRHLHEREGWT